MSKCAICHIPSNNRDGEKICDYCKELRQTSLRDFGFSEKTDKSVWLNFRKSVQLPPQKTRKLPLLPPDLTCPDCGSLMDDTENEQICYHCLDMEIATPELGLMIFGK